MELISCPIVILISVTWQAPWLIQRETVGAYFWYLLIHYVSTSHPFTIWEITWRKIYWLAIELFYSQTPSNKKSFKIEFSINNYNLKWILALALIYNKLQLFWGNWLGSKIESLDISCSQKIHCKSTLNTLETST